MLKSEQAKQTIIEAATELISNSSGNMSDITTRMIAEKAGVGVGLINYHFQTKDNLIETCVQRIISQVTEHFRPQLEPGLGPRERLKQVVKLVADFLIANPSLSRISILADHNSPAPQDNTMKTVKGFASVWTKEGKEAGEHSTVLLFALTAVIQAVFLRKELTFQLFGFDFREKDQRDGFLDLLVDRLLMKGDEGSE